MFVKKKKKKRNLPFSSEELIAKISNSYWQHSKVTVFFSRDTEKGHKASNGIKGGSKFAKMKGHNPQKSDNGWIMKTQWLHPDQWEIIMNYMYNLVVTF